jgi:uncharacterized membrane protein YkgB
MHQRMINQRKHNGKTYILSFSTGLRRCTIGASAVLAILNGNVALFAGCATMMLVVAALSLWAEARA